MNLTSSRSIRMLVAGLCCCAIFAVTRTNAVTQTENKKIIIQKLTLVKYPVEVSFRLNGEPLQSKESFDTNEGFRFAEFEAGADWIKNFSIVLKNTSGQTITYLNLNLHFVEITKSGRTALDQIFVGVDPDRKFSRPELLLKPDQTLEIRLADEYAHITDVAKATDNYPVEKISRVWVEFHAALFDDGTMFQAGTWYRRDPNDPKKWIVIEKP